MVRVSITLVEDVFPGLENTLDVCVRASTPSRLVGDETLVKFASVSMAGEGLGETTKEFARGGTEHVVGRDFWRVNISEFIPRGCVR